MNNHWEIIFEEQLKEKDLKLINPVLIEGLPGIGNVGKIAIDFLIDELKAKKLCSFFSYKFPHSVFVNENNLIEMPKLELYYKKFFGKGKDSKGKMRDLLLLTGDIQPIDEESCFTFCETILNLAKNYGCNEVITTGGIGLQNIPDKPKVYCTGNDEALLKQYAKKEFSVEKEIFWIVGPIIGVSGILLGLGKKNGVKGVALLAETFGHPLFLGIKGAKEIMRVLNQKFSLGVNETKLSKEIIEVEKELIKKTKEWASETLGHTQAGATLKKKDIEYIG